MLVRNRTRRRSIVLEVIDSDVEVVTSPRYERSVVRIMWMSLLKYKETKMATALMVTD